MRSPAPQPESPLLIAFRDARPRLFAIAYRMLGSASEADDVLQEVWLRADPDTPPRDPSAWFATVTTRLCIDWLRSARRRREQYVGPWLPEPIPSPAPDRVELAESLSLAFLTLLEQLGPVERAAFLLREVFDYEYPAIGALLERKEAACRQLVRRARQRVEADRPRYEADPLRQQTLLAAFAMAVQSGDRSQLERVLTEDCVLLSDGGGVVGAARLPVVGARKVALFLTRVARGKEDLVGQPVLANGQLAIELSRGGVPIQVMTFEGDGQGRVRAIRSVLAPDKLAFWRRQAG